MEKIKKIILIFTLIFTTQTIIIACGQSDKIIAKSINKESSNKWINTSPNLLSDEITTELQNYLVKAK